MSSLLDAGNALAGVFTLALGIVHLWVPRIFAFDRAIGRDAAGLPDLGSIAMGRWAYRRRRSDLIGLGWVMSNAASYVLISIGIVDPAWASGDRTVPIRVGAIWIAGWWSLRAAGQFVLGRRSGDLGLGTWFLALAAWHLLVAFELGHP